MGLLADDASAHLEKLSDHRYRLRVRDLDFEVMDRWNADAVRSVKTLSGGETFLTALAVALALADRVAGRAEAAHGQHPLESLFIDEGFGTLDAGETLENVAEALRQLQATHRVIGVVTHLPKLAEQLPAQIRVIKEVGGSRVEMVAN
jgi:exonuclease SbcC